MIRTLQVALALTLGGSFALGALPLIPQTAPNPASPATKVLREYKGIKLGLKRDAVHTTLGKPESANDTSDDYRLVGDDTMTLHYNNGEVKAIQLAFLDPKNAPAWKDVVGDAEVNEMANGAKTARKVVAAEKFWVSIYQNKEGTTTRITISR